jgi:hypothetical protein
VMQLPENRLALRRIELETRHSRSKGIVSEVVMIEKRLVSMQTGHGALINF